MMEQAGLQVSDWKEKVQESITYFKAAAERMATDGPPPIGIHLLMGANAKDKLQNYVRGLSEDRLCVGLGMAHKP